MDNQKIPDSYFDRFQQPELEPLDYKKTWNDVQKEYWQKFFAERADNLQRKLDFFGNDIDGSEMGWKVDFTEFFYNSDNALSMTCFVQYDDFPQVLDEFSQQVESYEFVEGEK